MKGGALGISLSVQWLGLRAFTAEGTGSIPGRGTRFLQAAQRGQKKKKKGGALDWVITGRLEPLPPRPSCGSISRLSPAWLQRCSE